MEVQGHDGIQKLLAAEQEAQRVVSEARKQKGERLRTAKAEAERDIASFRADCEAEFQKKISAGGDSSSAQFSDMLKSTDGDVAKVKKDTSSLKGKVTEALVAAVLDVKLATQG
uniref:V-type proton ATPase subunit G n=2 Tax=Eukaryota TaxID=2759 RepID=A0A7S1T8E4_9CHLO|mmetsp:Transcript_8179/g.14755  ORF Transcript_8179/g.14755 Transcript_8179/m.14755 type:complete len:114 (+) Transcript_8179:195-536(+)